MEYKLKEQLVEFNDEFGCMIIGICGGSASGKTYLAELLKGQIGEDCYIISYDSYYKSIDDQKIIDYNFDEPSALDTPLLISHLKKLKKKSYIEVPKFSFLTSKRLKKNESVSPKLLFIVEGILSLYNKNLLKLYDFTVYIDTPADIRLGRRMIRDTTERGRSILDVYKQYIKTVRVMHKKYVEPCRSVADIIVSGEDGEEKVSVEQILKELKKKTINHI